MPRKVGRKNSSKTMHTASYETKMFVVILLLLLIYPLGLIAMWGWMRQWPIWIKLLISLPFICALSFVITAFILVSSAIRQGRFQRHMYYRMQNNYPMYQTTPTPTYTPPHGMMKTY